MLLSNGRSRFPSILLLALLALSVQGQTNGTEKLITVAVESKRAMDFSAADLAKLPRRTVRVKDHDGKEAIFEGIELYDLLKLAGAPFGTELRGDKLSLFLLVEAADGYKAVFALPEIDKAFTDRVVLVADRRDGQPLSAAEGKLRLVVPDEKRYARWVRQVIRLSIQRSSR